MKKILCYGDSNTFGYNPLNGERFEENQRWSGILKKLLNNYEIIEEGKNNRTGFVSNPDGFEFSANRHFPKLLNNLKSVDILILAIGSNDLQFQYDISFKNIERGLELLISVAKSYRIKNIILVPPVILDNNILDGNFKHQFDESSIKKSKHVNKIYKKLARILNCKYFDFNEIASPSELDGLHYTETSHAKIAESLALFIKNEVPNE